MVRLTLIVIGVLVLLFLTARLIVTYVVTRRVLCTRCSWAMIPPEDFDVSLRAIEHIAEQLSGAYPWWQYWAFKQAAAIRVKLIVIKGRLLYVWEAPLSVEPVIFTVAGVYHVEVLPLGEALERLRDTETT